MKNPYIPRFQMDHDLPLGSFWGRMKWHGIDVDVYFFSEGGGTKNRDSYMCRCSDEPSDYYSGDAGSLPFDLGFSEDTSLEYKVQMLREIILLTEAYQEWKGLKEDPCKDIREHFKKETYAKHLELSPMMLSTSITKENSL